MSGLANLNPIVGGINAVGGLVKSVFGDKSAKEDNIHSEEIAVLNQASQEAAAQLRENRSWFDVFVDGLNRLPRPVLAFLVIWTMIWPVYDLNSFAATMIAYQAVPVWLAGIWATVISFFFGGRLLATMDFSKAKTSGQIKEIVAQVQELKDSHTNLKDHIVSSTQPASMQENLNTVVPATPETLALELRDNTKPLSLPSIVEWNRLHNPDWKNS